MSQNIMHPYIREIEPYIHETAAAGSPTAWGERYAKEGARRGLGITIPHSRHSPSLGRRVTVTRHGTRLDTTGRRDEDVSIYSDAIGDPSPNAAGKSKLVLCFVWVILLALRSVWSCLSPDAEQRTKWRAQVLLIRYAALGSAQK